MLLHSLDAPTASSSLSPLLCTPDRKVHLKGIRDAPTSFCVANYQLKSLGCLNNHGRWTSWRSVLPPAHWRRQLRAQCPDRGAEEGELEATLEVALWAFRAGTLNFCDKAWRKKSATALHPVVVWPLACELLGTSESLQKHVWTKYH